MNAGRAKALVLAAACIVILLLLTVECMAAPQLGWLWITTGILVLVLLAACIVIAIRKGRR